MAYVPDPTAMDLDLVTGGATLDPDSLPIDLWPPGAVTFPEYHLSGTVQVRSVGAPRALSILSLVPAGIEEVNSGASDADGDYSIFFRLDNRYLVFALAIDDYGEPWETAMVLAEDDLIHPSTPNGFVYLTVTAGTLPASEPTWWADYTGEAPAQTFGTAVLKAIQYLRPAVLGPIVPEPVV
jgi:hypothetical protein